MRGPAFGRRSRGRASRSRGRIRPAGSATSGTHTGRGAFSNARGILGLFRTLHSNRRIARPPTPYPGSLAWRVIQDRRAVPQSDNPHRGRDAKEEQHPDFLERKSRLLRPRYHRQPVQHGVVVTPLPAHPPRRSSENLFLLIGPCVATAAFESFRVPGQPTAGRACASLPNPGEHQRAPRHRPARRARARQPLAAPHGRPGTKDFIRAEFAQWFSK